MEGELRTPKTDELLESMRWTALLARSLVRDPGTADDVTQETLLASLARPREDGSPPRAWLARVLRSRLREQRRSESSRVIRERETGRRPEVPSPDELAERVERQRLLVEAVSRLEEPFRSTVLLRYIDGFSAADIARAQDVPAGTVRWRISRALERLREDLDVRFDGDRGAWMAALAPLAELPSQWIVTSGGLKAAALMGGIVGLKVWIGAAVALALAGGIVWWKTDTRMETETAALARGTGAAGTPDAPAPAAPSEHAPTRGRETRAPVYADPAKAATRVVTGRAIWTDACPDPGAEVFALRAPTTYTELAERLARAPWDPDQERKLEAELLARAAVAADGTFRLVLPEDAVDVHLALRGPKVYASETVELDAAPELEALAGTRLTGQLAGPAGSELAGIRVEITNRFGMQSRVADAPRFEVDLESGPGGAFTVSALPAHVEYEVLVRPAASLSARRLVLGPVAACAEESCTIELTPGGTVRGRVVNEQGEALAHARVKAHFESGPFGAHGALAREATADASGGFELRWVPPGTMQLFAEAPGYLENRARPVEITEGGVVDGVVIELGSGQRITGEVRWSDGRPAADVPVVASYDPAYRVGPTAFQALRGARAETRTEPNGTFTMTGLGGGPFVLSVEVQPDGASAPHRAQRDAIKPGAQDIALTLNPPLTLVGEVVAASGAAITDFDVRATRITQGPLGDTGSAWRRESFKVTDGHFRIEGLVEGRWRVAAEAAGHAQIADVFVELPQSGALRLELHASVAVEGVVHDTSGAAVADATVRVDPGLSELQELVTGLPAPRSTTTDEEGRFRLEGVPPAVVQLAALAEGYCRGTPVAVDTSAGATVQGVVLSLTAGGTVGGEVLDERGEAAAGRLVNLVQWGLGSYDARQTTVGDDGRFHFDNVIPGPWVVLALDADRDLVPSGEGGGIGKLLSAALYEQVNVEEGVHTEVLLGAEPEASVRVFGRVTHGDEPQTDAMIKFYPGSGGRFADAVDAVLDDGRYELDLPRGGAWIVTVETFMTHPGEHNVIEFLREVPAAGDARLDFELPLGVISGTVLAPDGRPAAGARVGISPDGPLRSDSLYGGAFAELRADDSGHYTITGIAPGTYRVAAGGAAFLNADERASFARVIRSGVELADGEALTLDFELPLPGSIAATVREPGGSHAGNAALFVRDAEGRVQEGLTVATTGPDGRVLYSGLAPGEYTLIARRGELASEESKRITVPSGGTAEATLELAPGTIIAVRLKDSQGEPTAATVRVVDASGRPLESFFGPDDLQRFLTSGRSPHELFYGPLAPGTYRVRAEGVGGGSANKRVRLRGEPEKRVVLRLR
ncbi:MAG: sigma-70 family RNA polymerase sigma factor [bacterium]|nr:sigma-70 family RNA polymerase sigma factor [bacterium]